MSHTVSLQGVNKSYGSVVAVADVTLNLAAGTTTAIVGESGCGKSTLLQMVNGVVVPDSGEVTVFGEAIDYANAVSLRRRVGYCVQAAGLFPNLSVFDNVTLLARLEGWPNDKVEARLAHLMQLVQLDEELTGRYPSELSGGQQQRVGLMRAMMLEPPVLLLDEPFSAIDPITRAGIHDAYLELKAAEPVTALLVTHDLREARRLADALVIMREGRILQQGDVEAVIADPEPGYVAQLLGGQLT